jgi:muconate cycloisomerase
MRITKLSVYLIRWPFNLAVSHSLAKNTATANIVLELTDESGRAGYGEGVPRDYVTGEGVEGSLAALRGELGPLVLGRRLEPEQALGWLEDAAGAQVLDAYPAAACALETALLDLAGQRLGRPVSALLSERHPAPVTYSAVVPLLPPEVLPAILGQVKALGLQKVKVKVERRGAADLVGQVRRALGSEASLRVDANGAWSPEEAVTAITALAELGVEAVEQPVPAGDPEDMARVHAAVEPLLIADESLCIRSDAEALIARRAVDCFNLRLSKCGGPARTLDLLDQARQAGLKCMLGCQVGELGLLSALGRHFASVHPELLYLEGSLTRFFLERDLIADDLTFGPGGRAPALAGPGLGVRVKPEVLAGSECFTLS